MSIQAYDDLNSMQIDVLKEIGNIGSGNAATALSGMLGRTIDMVVPNVQVIDYSDAIEFAGGPESIVAGILVRLEGDIEGMIMFLLEKPFAETIISSFMGTVSDDFVALNEYERSALTEMGNIMAGAYLSAISQLTDLFINISVPSLTIDMLGAIMSVPAIEFAQVGDKVLLINESFIIDNKHIKSNMILIPEVSSLDILLKKLGVN